MLRIEREPPRDLQTCRPLSPYMPPASTVPLPLLLAQYSGGLQESLRSMPRENRHHVRFGSRVPWRAHGSPVSAGNERWDEPAR